MCAPLAVLAPIIGGALSASGAVGGAVVGANSAADASKKQADSARDAMGFQREMWQQQQENQAPWLAGGKQSLADLLQQMQAGGFDKQVDAKSLANDPGYQFRMQEGQKALERSASARGMLNSGSAMKGMERYSQGLASDEYQNAWNRNQADNTGRFGRLASLAGVGQQSAQSLGQFGSQNAQQMGNLYGALGNAQSAGSIGVGNAISGGLGSVGNTGMALGMGYGSGLFGGQPQYIPPANPGAPASYGQSTMGFQTSGYGPWR